MCPEILQAIVSYGVSVDINATNKKNVTALMIACKDMEEVDAIDVLLNAGADPNFADADGDTWLHYAAQNYQCPEILQAIISYGKGVHVNAINKKTVTALMIACKDMREKDALSVLLNAGADPNIADADGDTCLHYAAQNYHCPEILQAIVSHGKGVDVNASNKKNVTALMIACKDMEEKDAIDVLLNAGADPNFADADGDTWLHYVAQNYQCPEILQAIINHGVNVDVNATNKKSVTALMIACKELREKDAINVLLNAGADPNIADADGDTWLHYAAQNYQFPEILQEIISHVVGVDANATNRENVTALMIACKTMEQKDVIDVLLNAGADPNIADDVGDTWLHYAAQNYWCPEILQAVISHGVGVDVNATNKQNVTALMITCREMDEKDAIKVLLNAGADPNIVDAEGNTWLHYAAQNILSTEALQVVISHGVDVDVNATNKKNVTALMTACGEMKNKDAINALLNAGADPDIVDADGNTWLHYAAQNIWSTEALQVVISHGLGIDVNATNKKNATALMIACKGMRKKDAINVLLNAGANPNIADADGDTWLHYAAQRYEGPEILQAIISYGVNVDINATNKKNVTALMTACRNQHKDSINVLLNAGADPKLVDADGNAWFHYAAQSDVYVEVLQAIISRGVDANATNKYKITALMKACYNGNRVGINVLLNAATDINIVDNFGRTCLHYIFYNEHCDLQACIDHCTDITDTNIKIQAALVLQRSDLFAVSVILKFDLDPNIPNHNHICNELLQEATDLGADLYVVKEENAAAQLLACNRALTTSMNVLLRSGADTSTVDVFGDTCLHKILHREYMSLEYDHETLQVLLDHGVPVNATNKNHQTAYMLAFHQGNIDAMCALLNAGADPNITRYDDKDDDDSNLHHIDTGDFINVTQHTIMQWLNPAWHYLDLPALEITECLSSNLVSHIICNIMRRVICKRK